MLGLYWGHIGIMEKKLETTIMVFGVRVGSPHVRDIPEK